MSEISERVREEYDALRSRAALLDCSSAGKLELSGKNAVQFLNGIVSNDVKTLAPGAGVLAAFPTLQEKSLALCRIYNTGNGLLLELDSINREKIFKNLSRFVPAGEFFVKDQSDALALVRSRVRERPRWSRLCWVERSMTPGTDGSRTGHLTMCKA